MQLNSRSRQRAAAESHSSFISYLSLNIVEKIHNENDIYSTFLSLMIFTHLGSLYYSHTSLTVTVWVSCSSKFKSCIAMLCYKSKVNKEFHFSVF